jgi:hypothetical protein
MRQWELYGITDSEEARTGPTEPRPVAPQPLHSSPRDHPAISDGRFPMVLWTTDHLLQFTSSPPPGVGDLGLALDPEGGGLLELFGPKGSGLDVIDAHLGALGGWPTQCDVRGGDRTFHCEVSPLRSPAGDIIGTTCVARYEVIEVDVGQVGEDARALSSGSARRADPGKPEL